MITKERLQELESYFWAESNDPETKEWREDLTAGEEALVAQWDERVAAVFIELLSAVSEINREVAEQ